MDKVFESTYRIDTVDANMFGILRTSRLLELIQLVSGTHAGLLGFGGSVLDPKNLGWVIVRQRLECERMPRRGETLRFITWPGKGMHGLFPRYMQIENADTGEILVRSSVLWVIMDKASRTMIQPASCGLEMVFSEKPALLPLPKLPKDRLPEIKCVPFTVPFCFVDILGHMNNARYLDAAENVLDDARAGRSIQSLVIEYSHEAKLDETVDMHVGHEGGDWSVRGMKNGEQIFSLYVTYA